MSASNVSELANLPQRDVHRSKKPFEDHKPGHDSKSPIDLGDVGAIPLPKSQLEFRAAKSAIKLRRVLHMFEKVERALDEFDKSKVGQQGFSETWARCQQKYRQFLFHTSELADRMSQSSEDFEDAILPLAASIQASESQSPEQSKKIRRAISLIDKYIAANTRAAKHCKEQANVAQEIESDVHRFREDLDSFVEVTRAQLLAMKDAAQENPIMGPFLELLKQKFEETQTAATKLREQLEKNGDYLKQTKEGVEFFELTWNTANNDSVKIKKYLEDTRDMVDQAASVPTILRIYLKNTETLYGTLGESLGKYAMAIRDTLHKSKLGKSLGVSSLDLDD